MTKEISPNQLTFFIGKKVRINLRTNEKLEGILNGFDQFTNLTLTNLFVIVGDKTENIGYSLVRGNMIISIQPIEQ